MPRLFCFRLGYTARRFAASVAADGWSIGGTGRSGGPRGVAGAGAVDAVGFDREHPLAAAGDALSGVSHILVSIPPDAGGDPALQVHGGDIVRFAGPSLRWIGYLSTTGVYGDRSGGWVGEDAEPRPDNARSRWRVAAEDGWRTLGKAEGFAVNVFRLAGIYGPGRSQLDAVRTGRAHRIDRPGQVFSRIHVDDIVRTLRAAIDRPRADAVYNVADDLPAPAHEVTAFACELLGVAPPPLVPLDRAALSPIARGFYAENRRVANARIKRELGIVLSYPDYRIGLRAILAAETAD